MPKPCSTKPNLLERRRRQRVAADRAADRPHARRFDQQHMVGGWRRSGRSRAPHPSARGPPAPPAANARRPRRAGAAIAAPAHRAPRPQRSRWPRIAVVRRRLATIVPMPRPRLWRTSNVLRTTLEKPARMRCDCALIRADQAQIAFARERRRGLRFEQRQIGRRPFDRDEAARAQIAADIDPLGHVLVDVPAVSLAIEFGRDVEPEHQRSAPHQARSFGPLDLLVWMHGHCFTEIPALLDDADQRSKSCRMRAANSCGVVNSVSAPSAAKVCLSAGSAIAAASALCRRSTISGGVPAGASTPFQVVTTRAGQSGLLAGRHIRQRRRNDADRSPPARGACRLLISEIADGSVANIAVTCPPIDVRQRRAAAPVRNVQDHDVRPRAGNLRA